jgi:hypothetical protein
MSAGTYLCIVRTAGFGPKFATSTSAADVTPTGTSGRSAVEHAAAHHANKTIRFMALPCAPSVPARIGGRIERSRQKRRTGFAADTVTVVAPTRRTTASA